MAARRYTLNWRLKSAIGALSAVRRPLGAGRHHGARAAPGRYRGGRGLGGVHVGLLLGLHDVLLVADPLVSEPVAHLKRQSVS